MSDIIPQLLNLLNQNRFDEAIPLMDQVLTQIINDSKILLRIGDAYRKKALETADTKIKGALAEKALYAFRRATIADPQNYIAWIRLGHFYLYYLDEYDKAVEAFLQAYPKIPTNWELNTALGHAYLGKNTVTELEKAIQYFKKSQDLAPDQFDPMFFGAISIKKFNIKALETDPNFEPNLDFALELMEEAYYQFPQQFQVRDEFKLLKQEVFAIYSQYLRDHDDCAAVWYHMGVLEYIEKAYNKAISCFTNALELDPTIFEGKYYLGMSIYLGNHDPIKAKAILLSCVKIDPTFLEAWLALGDIALETNEWVEARNDYQSVLKLDPENPMALEGIQIIQDKIISEKVSIPTPEGSSELPVEDHHPNKITRGPKKLITVRIPDTTSYDEIWQRNPDSGLFDKTFLQVFVDQLQDEMPAKIQSIIADMPIKRVEIPLVITIENEDFQGTGDRKPVEAIVDSGTSTDSEKTHFIHRNPLVHAKSGPKYVEPSTSNVTEIPIVPNTPKRPVKSLDHLSLEWQKNHGTDQMARPPAPVLPPQTSSEILRKQLKNSEVENKIQKLEAEEKK